MKFIYQTKPKLKRMKNKTTVLNNFDSKSEMTFQKKQFEEHVLKYEKACKITPLFFGTPGGDFRGNNVFLKLSSDLYLPQMPKVSDFGHLSYEDSRHVFWPNNMQGLLEKHHLPRI